MKIVEAELERWAAAEAEGWHAAAKSREHVARDMVELAEYDPTIALLQIDDGDVCIDPRCAMFDHPSAEHRRILLARAELYRNLVHSAVVEHEIPGRAVVGVFIEDRTPPANGLPLLCFQKEEGAPNALLPDVDFMALNYYADDTGRYIDRIAFDDKLPEAIFVGSTTGTPVLTMDDVTRLTNERLRSAVFFKDRPEVVFSLPNIIQYDSSATHDAINALGFDQRPATWQEQFGYRWLISMDGNGATCSRMVIGLLSNSVLLKYRSNSRLFYFHGLRPGVHYIPIDRDQQVVEVIAAGEEHRADQRRIAEAGTRFAEAYLGRRSVISYTAKLLSRYIERFGLPDLRSRWADMEALDSYTQVKGVGTVWTHRDRWSGAGRNPIEGFAVMPSGDIAGSMFDYAAIYADGDMSPFVRGGEFCGTSGAGKPIFGMWLRETAMEETETRLFVRCRFHDGSMSPWSTSGTPVSGASPLIAFKVLISEATTLAPDDRKEPVFTT